ncbi:hypothetical protein D9611_011347 [Ephemerocybe angulata]|uniref:Uncharacterized protein n=1 Tax=Ephemerocybe angulata TaxID=980116 RepID=A0A8H5F1G4_9AGAR|nr:hypothetical protein D9611_011347 [Tulosesus angulatus]
MAMRIAKLRDELKDLEHQLQLHKCVFSPARRIPTEVLTMIFDIASTPAKPPWSSYDDSEGWERDRKCLSTITLTAGKGLSCAEPAWIPAAAACGTNFS